MKSKVLLIASMLFIANTSFACIINQQQVDNNLANYASQTEDQNIKLQNAQKQEVQYQAIIDTMNSVGINETMDKNANTLASYKEELLKGTSFYIPVQPVYDRFGGVNSSYMNANFDALMAYKQDAIQKVAEAKTDIDNVFPLTEPDTTICTAAPIPEVAVPSIPVITQSIPIAVKEVPKNVIKKPVLKEIVVQSAQPVINQIPIQVIQPTPIVKHNWFINILLKIKSWF